MKTISKTKICTIIIGLLFLILVMTRPVKAADTCTVTFLPGNGGSFSNFEVRATDGTTTYTEKGEGGSSGQKMVLKPGTFIYLSSNEGDGYYSCSGISNSDSDKFLLGWAPEGTDGQIYSEAHRYKVDSDITFTAVWGKGISVTLDADGGTIDSGASKIVKFRPGRVLRSSYDISGGYNPRWADESKHFAGWAKTKGDKTSMVTYSNPVTLEEDITLYALWDDTVKVHYDLCGGTATGDVSDGNWGLISGTHSSFDEYVTKDSYKYLSTYWGFEKWDYKLEIKPPAGTSGVLLDGWNTDKTAARALSSSLRVTDDITLYPIWVPAHTVTLHANGGRWAGSVSGNDIYTYSCKDGLDLSTAAGYRDYYLSAPEGKLHKGWTTAPSGSGARVTYNDKLTSDVDLYAVWVNKVTVTYDANGGYIGTQDTTTKQVVFGEGDPLYSGCLPAINDDHKEFAGWSYTPNGPVIEYLYSEKAQKDITLYAVWGDAYCLTFKANGGSMSYYDVEHKTGDIVTSKIQKVLKGETAYGPYPYSTVKGYGLSHWETDSGFEWKQGKGFRPDGDMTFTAVWLPTVTVVYDRATEGCPEYYGDSYSVEVIKGSPFDYDVHSFYYEGEEDPCLIKAWSLTPDGSQPVDNTYIVNEPVTLYAVWTPAAEVYIHADQGYITDYYGEYIYQTYTDSGTYEYQDEVWLGLYSIVDAIGSVWNKVFRDGFAFAGWSLTRGGAAIDISQYKPQGETGLYPIWTASFYTVTVMGTAKDVKIRVPQGALLKSYVDNYLTTDNFIGFSETEGGTAIDTDTYRVSDDVTLYASFRDEDKKADDMNSKEKAEGLVDRAQKGIPKDLSQFSIPDGSSVDISDIQAVKDEKAISSLKDVVTGLIDKLTGKSVSVSTLELFDLVASGMGKVGIKVGEEYEGCYVIVGHYHNGIWSTQQCKVDMNGYIYPNFTSFSPISLLVTDSKDELTDISVTEPGVIGGDVKDEDDNKGDGNNSGGNDSGNGGKYKNHAHVYAKEYTPDKKATFSSDGKKSRQCTGCSSRGYTVYIPRVSFAELSFHEKTCNGKKQQPKVTVKDSNGELLKEKRDYTLSYDGDGSVVGRYTVTVTLTGFYDGVKKLKYTIRPRKISKLTAKGGAGSAGLKWKKPKDADGVEVAYSTDRRFTKKKTKKKTAAGSASGFTIKKLKKDTVYYVRIRTFKNAAGGRVYSAWSAAKKIRTK